MTAQEFIASVTREVRFFPDRGAIGQELKDHLDDSAADLQEFEGLSEGMLMHRQWKTWVIPKRSAGNSIAHTIRLEIGPGLSVKYCASWFVFFWVHRWSLAMWYRLECRFIIWSIMARPM